MRNVIAWIALLSLALLAKSQKATHFTKHKVIESFVPSDELIPSKAMNAVTCALKCLNHFKQCSASSFEATSKMCTLGLIDRGRFKLETPSDSGISILANENAVQKTPHEVCHFYYFEDSGMYHYSTEEPLAPTNGVQPSQLPTQMEDGTLFTEEFNIFHFKDQIYFCRFGENCRTWDIYTGEWELKSTGMAYLDNKGASAIAQFGARICIVGGQLKNGAATDQSECIDENDVWSQGPTLPEANIGHTLVTISDQEVLYMGGYLGAPIFTCHMYSTITGQFTAKAMYSMAKHGVTAVKFTMQDGRDVVIAIGFELSSRVEIYDIAANSWFETEPFAHPSAYGIACVLNSGNKLFYMPVITSGYVRIPEVWEFTEDSKWIEQDRQVEIDELARQLTVAIAITY